ncbi:HTH-type transcriptional regulator gltC [Nocardia africana]|uniref:HTH-type transcriptional regulator gltC n=1 Tax=Nocardia africana TaxID=134964 RepID=A0A378X2U9_9NOCA|nr:HTH-type transcriptional regulator gltC [Nocardia africana]
MPSDDLHWFLTLAELERVGAAADRLRLAQPTLSRMLARLEQRLGTQLFDRHGKRLTLNESGRIFYEHARRAQAELDAAGRALADLANPARGSVRLAFLHSFGGRVVPELIAGFRRVSGRITFRLDQGPANVVAAEVLDGTADLGLTSPEPALPGLGWRTLSGSASPSEFRSIIGWRDGGRSGWPRPPRPNSSPCPPDTECAGFSTNSVPQRISGRGSRWSPVIW